ncbi:lasso peptide biosynthesis B2 protein [Streptomyces sp. NBC_01433]|uniref:lasso peptide biosynthesis B2 protein n=1 Tax=Streptomyces sp. NBC_01433 TaxID=2903864 RepID=UPI00225B2A31|nr:lasso peptide biosynthesis B2 protein [Streptomyces sp. NBC_01433]MCX4676730.1 lasso peptide biosynthesis B2 protein [Streptomyces sp. NBC_01433]
MTTNEAWSTARTGTFGERVAALTGLLLALLLLRLPFRYTVRAVRWARIVGRRPAGRAQGEVLVLAVRHAGRWWPGRVACMETSLGAVLAASLLGQRLDWCLGVRFTPPPVEYHAWAALPDAGPVGEYTAAGWHHHTALTI